MSPCPVPTCPFGILNINAIAETIIILQRSSKEFHAQLCSWIRENYLEDVTLYMSIANDEPLGRRIKSIADLSILVCAYSNARAQKRKTTRKAMDHALYFHECLPERDAAIEAGLLLNGFEGI